MALLAGLSMTAIWAAGSALGEGRDEAAPAQQCVYRPFKDTRIIDKETLFVEDRSGNAVLLHMSAPCLYSRNEPIGLEFSGSSSRICHPLDVDVTGTIATVPTRCIIQSVEGLTKEQAADYRKR